MCSMDLDVVVVRFKVQVQFLEETDPFAVLHDPSDNGDCLIQAHYNHYLLSVRWKFCYKSNINLLASSITFQRSAQIGHITIDHQWY